jgi:hypothetical protein
MSARNHRLCRCLALLLPLAALVVFGAVQAQPQFTDENFEQWVFQEDHTAAAARKRLEASVSVHVDHIDRACRLTEAQKKKLQLAGRGDIKRFFDRYEVVRQKFQGVKNDQQAWNQMWQDINPLQMSLQSGLFHEDSFLFRCMPHTLTAEQWPSYEALAQERRAFHHRVTIEMCVSQLEQIAPLRAAQRRELLAFLTKEMKPPRKSNFYYSWMLLVRLAQLPEDKLKPFFEKTQWKAVNQLLVAYKGQVQWLRQNGQWDDDDDEADKPAPPREKKELEKK